MITRIGDRWGTLSRAPDDDAWPEPMIAPLNPDSPHVRGSHRVPGRARAATVSVPLVPLKEPPRPRPPHHLSPPRFSRRRLITVVLVVGVIIAAIVAVMVWPRPVRLTDRQFLSMVCDESFPFPEVRLANGTMPPGPADLSDEEITELFHDQLSQWTRVPPELAFGAEDVQASLSSLRGAADMWKTTAGGSSIGGTIFLLPSPQDAENLASDLINGYAAWFNQRFNTGSQASASSAPEAESTPGAGPITTSTVAGFTVWRFTLTSEYDGQFHLETACLGNIALFLFPSDDPDLHELLLPKLATAIDESARI